MRGRSLVSRNPEIIETINYSQAKSALKALDNKLQHLKFTNTFTKALPIYLVNVSKFTKNPFELPNSYKEPRNLTSITLQITPKKHLKA